VVLAEVLKASGTAQMAAGHSLGEFSALAAMGALGFADGLRLVKARAEAMQAACDAQPSTMAAIIGMEDAAVEALCAEAGGFVVPANYNSPGQLVISGAVEAVERAVALAKERGARLAKLLPVNGAFHSPLMEPARVKLATAIEATTVHIPACPIYQNVTARPETDPEAIRRNLIAQLTAPVRWTQTVQQMHTDGATRFVELGPGTVLQGLVKRIVSGVETESRSEA
jgi:[acyl-carrier-protein] S-malonyltransferase